MRNILASPQLAILGPFAWSETLVAFDYDGTLTPPVADPARAVLRPETRSLLRRVAALYPSVVISGRSLSDLKKRVGGLGLRGVVDNHGVEPFRPTRAAHRRILEWRSLFESVLQDEPGVVVRDRTYSLDISFRACRAKKRVRRMVQEVAAELKQARLVGGVEVMSVVPADAPHKGIALERERSRLHCDTAIYVGDGESDEDVFALDQPGRLLTVRVGRKPGSRANFYLPSQASIDRFLRTLIRLRQGRSAGLRTPR